MKYKLTCLLSAIVSFLLAATPAVFSAENWDEFLGPQGRCHGLEAQGSQAPLTWSESENIVWKAEVAGRGWSSPVVWGNQIWFTTADEKGLTRSVLCYDKTTGKKIHDILLYKVEKPERCNKVNSFASPTPVVEEGRVYVHFGTVGTACLDMKTGKKLWERTDLDWLPIQGFGSSPIIYKNLIILTCDGGDVQFLIAFDKNSGKTVWKVDRSVKFVDEKPVFRKGYCTPTIRTWEGKDYMLSSASKAAYCYDPATGKEYWRFEFPRFSETSTMRPQCWKNLVIVNTGHPLPADIYALEIKSKGVLGENDIIWDNANNIGPWMTPVLVGDHLYMPDGKGMISCINVESGETTWKKRIGGNFWASPIYQKGRVYFFDDEGKTTVVAADPKECRVLATNTLDAGCMGTPAVLTDTIILRTKTHLYCIRKK
ncbi:MAG: PQQ-binding-like beta-propeller repeat protein [Planctomycetia bacterium]|nr:PQQ-binding-like beta-propeller repeat protein [Planctomycetia bacterium]